MAFSPPTAFDCLDGVIPSVSWRKFVITVEFHCIFGAGLVDISLGTDCPQVQSSVAS